MSVRIVQLTDLHLSQNPGSRLQGVLTWDSFQTVLDDVRTNHGDLDYLILTGDLAQDEELETYLMLREHLADFLERCRIIPGNHDDPGNLRRAFPELFEQSYANLSFAVSDGGWRVIGLDSHSPGETTGRIEADQLQWLQEGLARHPEAPTLIFVHHPPLPINVPWLDCLGLDNPAGFLKLVENSPQVRAVCCGHVHQESTGRIGPVVQYTTPSTCVQFGSGETQSFDTTHAGYRSFKLDEDHITVVHRLPI